MSENQEAPNVFACDGEHLGVGALLNGRLRRLDALLVPAEGRYATEPRPYGYTVPIPSSYDGYHFGTAVHAVVTGTVADRDGVDTVYFELFGSPEQFQPHVPGVFDVPLSEHTCGAEARPGQAGHAGKALREFGFVAEGYVPPQRTVDDRAPGVHGAAEVGPDTTCQEPPRQPLRDGQRSGAADAALRT